ncbi:MAG: UDP-glucose/GDP-mannose dehydrogenase family protein [Candidatus Micrarchaeota archaeon]
MKISVIGTGYVGLITGCGFAKLGHNVSCVDLDEKKVEMINAGKPPIYEKGLEELLKEVHGKNLVATTDLKSSVSGAELVFIAVGTPSREDGSMDNSYVEKAFLDAVSASQSFKVFVVKSTVVPGTTDSLALLAEKKLGKKEGRDYGLSMSPEFLREGKALEDFFSPDRIVIGASSERTMDVVASLYSGFKCPVMKTDRKTAEMVKYASNSFLATKVSFANEMGNLCKKLGIDVYEVMDGAGMDKRVGRSFLNAGVGYGGSCFPKDVKAIITSFKENGVEPKILEKVIEVNEEQPYRIVELARKKMKLNGKKVVVLGLAFKPDSDDMREAPSIKIIDRLLSEGAKVKAYDPEAAENAKKIFGERIVYGKSLREALEYSDVVFVVTEWDEFKDETLYNGKTVFDGRKVLKKKSSGDYEGICW